MTALEAIQKAKQEINMGNPQGLGYLRSLLNDAEESIVWEKRNSAKKRQGYVDGNPETEANREMLANLKRDSTEQGYLLEAFNRGCDCEEQAATLGIGLQCYHCEETDRLREKHDPDSILIF